MTRNRTDAVFHPDVLIANGESASGTIDNTKVGARGIGVYMPAVWTAAELGLQFSFDGDTWIPMRDEDGNVVKIENIKAAEASGYVFPAAAWAVGVAPYFQLVSLNAAAADTDWTPVTQGGNRTIKVLLLS